METISVGSAENGLVRDKAFLGGGWREALSGRRFPVSNPASTEAVGSVPDMGPDDAALAIEAADAALPGWRAAPPQRRSALLRRWAELIAASLDPLARILTTEQGKPLAEAKSEIQGGIRMLEWAAEEGRRVYGEILPAGVEDRRFVVVREPVGVVAAITPWNFPSSMIVRKCAAALAVGCTVVVKPAEATPLSALALAALAERAGLPPGVFNVVTTRDAAGVGAALTGSPRVRKLSFTGSTRTGKLLMAQCAATVKRVSLELGGNAPFIVFADADLDAALKGALTAKFKNAGQMCTSANRLLVQDSIYDGFAARFAEGAAALKAGNGLDPSTQLGPLLNAAAVAKVEGMVADAAARGGRLLTGGSRLNLGANFFAPTVIADATPEMRCAQEEIFGPVAPLLRFSDEAEAVRLANDTEAGLVSYVYTGDEGRGQRMQRLLQAGMVGVNVPNTISETAPFGGIKESGIGREGGKYVIDEYLETKLICIAEPALAV